jgi:hypothetical protein
MVWQEVLKSIDYDIALSLLVKDDFKNTGAFRGGQKNALVRMIDV